MAYGRTATRGPQIALSHHYALAVGYAVALIGWAGVFHVWRGLWPPPPDPAFARPWREVAWAGVGVVGVLLIGQLYSARLLLPRGPGSLGVLAECVNQALIFAPIVLVPVVRRHPPATAWVRTDRLGARLAIGIALALVATLAFVAVRADADAWPRVVTRMVHPRQLPIAIQVLLEDVAVAILVVRLAVATRPWIAVVATAALFAAGHIPALLTAAAPASQLFDLVLDFALAAGMLAVARRSADVTWLWCVHFAMDSMQWFAVRP